MAWKLDLGANRVRDDTFYFKVWAPLQKNLRLKLINQSKIIDLQKDQNGYFFGEIKNVRANDLYYYITDNDSLRPDPVSRFLPKTVHGPSAVFDPDAYQWHDAHWKGVEQEKLIIYECHIGTFTTEGTFTAAIKKLPYLQDLGITCLEIMPINQFPGRWNWGYDGASLYAVQNSYGGPNGLKQLIDACHQHRIAVCLDVVYNHFGPEGTYLADFGPYFSEKYNNPWGKALNVDGPFSDEVRHFLIQNALYWLDEYHFDALRLDAIQGIYDLSAYPFLEELNDQVMHYAKDHNRQIYLTAESDLNDARIIRDKKQGGYGLQCSWCDDFHHSLHVALTNEQRDYYIDFNGIENLAKSLKTRYVYDGQYTPFRKRCHGNHSADLPPKKFIICLQNHDQIGNRVDGSRIIQQISFEAYKLAAVVTILSPYIPLIFMGQEYGEEAPFLYFIDYGDQELQHIILREKQKEFGAENIDISEGAFQLSKLHWSNTVKNDEILQLYKALIAIRKQYPISQDQQVLVHYSSEQKWISWEYETTTQEWIGVICNFNTQAIQIVNPLQQSHHRIILDSNATQHAKFINGSYHILPESSIVVV